ncbi:MAG: DUF4255 domain-containing protein [Flavobacteriales bacterium]|nr:DUF4255 domain-containing protein [Flavobacteriales bacterium]
MIDTVLQFTANSLDQFVRNQFGLNESKVLINNLIEADGSVPKPNQNKLVISMINIAQETNRQFYVRNQRLSDGSFSNVRRPERYNIDLLVSSSFDDYTETLKFLNSGIQFFQINPVVNSSSYSNLPEGIDRLEFEVEKISYFEMHNLWSAMGAKYVPSVIYKMRLITIESENTQGFVAPVTNQSNPVLPNQ